MRHTDEPRCDGERSRCSACQRCRGPGHFHDRSKRRSDRSRGRCGGEDRGGGVNDKRVCCQRSARAPEVAHLPRPQSRHADQALMGDRVPRRRQCAGHELARAQVRRGHSTRSVHLAPHGRPTHRAVRIEVRQIAGACGRALPDRCGLRRLRCRSNPHHRHGIRLRARVLEAASLDSRPPLLHV